MVDNAKLQKFLKQLIIQGEGFIDFEKLKQMPGVTVEKIDKLTGNDRNAVVNYGNPQDPYKKKNIIHYH